MTQISVPTVPPDSAPLITTIPRPRRATSPASSYRSVGPVAVAGPVLVTDAAPATRRRTSWAAFGLDSSLALAIALSAAALGALPVDVALVAASAWALALLATGHFQRRALGEGHSALLRRVLGTGVRGAVIALALSSVLTTLDPVVLVQLVAAFSLASGVHLVCSARRNRPRLVLAGRPRDVREALLELVSAGRHDVVAVCLTRESKKTFGDLPTYVGFDTSSSVARHHRADALVVLPGARLTPTKMRRLHWALAGVGTELCVGTGLLDVTPTRTRVLTSGGLNVVHVAPASLCGARRCIKDVLERAAATVGLALLLPLLLAVGIIVRLETPGPALYRQQRVGKDGRLFTMYKVRSMSDSAEVERVDLMGCNEGDGVLFKIKRDPRVTPLGRWLRRWSIDEVPQLWNVVRGDMSLVGPRPALPEEVARYDADPRRRLVVKPGLTGLWQVSGRSDLTWAETVRLDVRYVDNWSLALDVAILARTVRAVLGHRGAY